jgi:hypothetical protein
MADSRRSSNLGTGTAKPRATRRSKGSDGVPEVSTTADSDTEVREDVGGSKVVLHKQVADLLKRNTIAAMMDEEARQRARIDDPPRGIYQINPLVPYTKVQTMSPPSHSPSIEYSGIDLTEAFQKSNRVWPTKDTMYDQFPKCLSRGCKISIEQRPDDQYRGMWIHHNDDELFFERKSLINQALDELREWFYACHEEDDRYGGDQVTYDNVVNLKNRIDAERRKGK